MDPQAILLSYGVSVGRAVTAAECDCVLRSGVRAQSVIDGILQSDRFFMNGMQTDAV